MALSSSNLISLATLWIGAVSAGAERRGGTTWDRDYERRDGTMLVKDLVSVPTCPSSLMRPQGRAWARSNDETTDIMPPFDISEDDDSTVQLKMTIPGLVSQDLNVGLENDRVLRVRGSRTRYENGYTSLSDFDESIRLGDNVDVGNLQVNLSTGVLTITAPKKPTRMRSLAISFDDPEIILNPRRCKLWKKEEKMQGEKLDNIY
jgi:HSP20 family molecular chaperone IbpA